jgi:hypothetical protein
MEYHRFITNPDRNLGAADRMDVFGGGTDPAGLGTLGAPVNPAHVFEYLGENLPAFGNPQDVVGAGAQSWEPGFENVYAGKYITEEQSRLSPNTTTVTIADPTPVVMRPDELTSVKNNAQIMREQTAKSVRTYRANPSADVLAYRVSADAEARNVQDQAVSLAYESQMDVIRAKHLGAHARGVTFRGENIGAMTPITGPQLSAQTRPSGANPPLLTRIKMAFSPAMSQVSPSAEPPSNLPVMTMANSSPAAQSGTLPMFEIGGGSASTPATNVYEDSEMGTYMDSSLEPTKVAMILGGVAVAAAAAYFLMRK